MREHHLSVSRSARYFTLGSVDEPRDVWFVCHGYGQLAARFLERFRTIERQDRLIVAPEALSRFYLTESPTERRVGASWMTREDRLSEIADYIGYLDAVHGAVVRPAARVTVLGFSQGSATACRWVAIKSQRFDRLIVWGGEIPPDVDPARLAGTRLTLVYGDRDEYFTPKIVTATQQRLRNGPVEYELVPFAGGHEIDDATLRALA
jgi:predicted esterase